MAIATEIIFLIALVCLILFMLILFLIRFSNGIASKKFSDMSERVNHLEKIAKHHSKLLTIENMKLKHRLRELEKEHEKREQIETTEQIVVKTLEKMKKKQ